MGSCRRIFNWVWSSSWILWVLSSAPVSALVFASPDMEPQTEAPPDFPYWAHVTQRRYEGPSVLYLGNGFALTARHVGMGEIPLDGVMLEPVTGSKRTMLNTNGTPADAMIFELDRETPIPDLPILPIATSPPLAGEEVLLIGFGRQRAKVFEWELEGESRFAFEWSAKGKKRWGTNRIESNSEIVHQPKFTTRSLAFVFDPPHSPRATKYEAQAAVGDSGGGVFVQRDGEWQLAALMISVSGQSRAPGGSSGYGDVTFAADLTHYRSEILRWTRPQCSNERDDDGDERTDFPADPGCTSALDRNEREGDLVAQFERGWLGLAVAASLGFLAWLFHQRKRSA